MVDTCHFLFVRCFDRRLNRIFIALLSTFGLTPDSSDYDILGIAGSVGDRQQLMKHLEISVGKHGVKKVILTAHDECAAGTTEADLLKALAEVKKSEFAQKLELIKAFFFYRKGSEWVCREVGR